MTPRIAIGVDPNAEEGDRFIVLQHNEDGSLKVLAEGVSAAAVEQVVLDHAPLEGWQDMVPQVEAQRFSPEAASALAMFDALTGPGTGSSLLPRRRVRRPGNDVEAIAKAEAKRARRRARRLRERGQ